ncbi:hypothetical protein AAIH42_34905, partial [Pseudomonas aeruginosa]
LYSGWLDSLSMPPFRVLQSDDNVARVRVISWNGIVTYGAMAMGAPLGVVFYHWGGLQALALIIMGVALVAILLAIPRPTVKASKGKPLPFRAVLGRVPYVRIVAL